MSETPTTKEERRAWEPSTTSFPEETKWVAHLIAQVDALEAENERLREALRQIAEPNEDNNHARHCVDQRRLARHALAPESPSLASGLTPG